MRAPDNGAAGACRRHRRRRTARRPEWVSSYRRAQRALDTSANIIFSALHTAVESERCATRRPLHTVRRLDRAVRRVTTVAHLRLLEAQRELAAFTACLDRVPEQQRAEAAELLELAAERCQSVALHLGFAYSDAVSVQMGVLDGLDAGTLVPEHPSDSRPRIIREPRPVPVRAFLAARQPRVADRISPILRRRRRTPRPAAVRVPRRSIRGRAPPLSSTCLL